MALASRSAGMRLSQRCIATAPRRAFGTSDDRPFPAIFSDTKVICQGFTGGQVCHRSRPPRTLAWDGCGGLPASAGRQEG